MKLEWFRHHKKFVYWILLPVVGLGMAFFGATSAIQQARMAKTGPSVTYRVGDRQTTLNPSEVLSKRFILTQFGRDVLGRSGGARSSDHVAVNEVAFATATDAGFNIGIEEARQMLTDEIRMQIMRRDSSQPPITDTIYRKLLEVMQLTPTQFERMVKQCAVTSKYFRYLSAQEEQVPDGALFADFMRDKEVVRLRYKTVKSEDFVAQVKEPDEARIKKFYDDNKDKRSVNVTRGMTQDDYMQAEEQERARLHSLRDIIFSKPKLSAEMLFMSTESFFKDDNIQPADKDLQDVYEKEKSAWKLESKTGEPEKYKPFADVRDEVVSKWRETEARKFYDRQKFAFWKEKPKAGEPEPKPGDEKFIPYEQVKDEVIKKWHEQWVSDEKVQRPRARLDALKTELKEAEKAHAKTQEGKKPEECKPFDVAAWAKSKDLVYWTTDELTEDQFRKGKKSVNAKDANFAAGLFFLKQETGYKAMDDRNKKDAEEFSPYPQVVDEGGKGLVVSRIKTYTDSQLLPFDAAKKNVAEHVKKLDAVELAVKEASRLHDAWARGEGLPAIDALEEVRGDREDKEPILAEFFASPRPVGEVVNIAQEVADKMDASNPHRHYFVGFAVERELPTWKTFHDDTKWPRDSKRGEISESDFRSAANVIVQRLAAAAHGDERADPPLFEEYRRGHSDED